METLNLDSIGPLPPDEWGNMYILVIICCFTRFVELYAIRDTGAVTAARCLLQHLGRYGAPSQIRSDRGTQFANDTIAELTKLIGTEQVLNLSYSHEENGIVERENKEVMRHLKAMVLEKDIKPEWSIHLPLIQRILNASEHSVLHVSPAQLLYGNAITLDRGIFLPQAEREGTSMSLSEWAAKMLEKQGRLLQIAKMHQHAADEYHIASANAQRSEFPVNSYVLVQYRERPPTKFHTNWKGPMRVINYNMYILYKT